MNSLIASSSLLAAFTSALNNILALIMLSYSLLCSKILDSSNYIQEQAELYFIVTKFIFEQAIPRIDPLTTLLILVQATSIAIIMYVLMSRIKANLRGNKKIKVNCGPQVEEIELVRVRRERSPAKPRDPPLTSRQNND